LLQQRELHTNTVESFFALFKRAVFGQFHHISEAHMFRYLAEADFKYNHRKALGIDDAARAEAEAFHSCLGVSFFC
jgi:phosphatidylserine/phosphatidylglycerophosphate/cardiolipin synthase-like enzyme